MGSICLHQPVDECSENPWQLAFRSHEASERLLTCACAIRHGWAREENGEPTTQQKRWQKVAYADGDGGAGAGACFVLEYIYIFPYFYFRASRRSEGKGVVPSCFQLLLRTGFSNPTARRFFIKCYNISYQVLYNSQCRAPSKEHSLGRNFSFSFGSLSCIYYKK